MSTKKKAKAKKRLKQGVDYIGWAWMPRPIWYDAEQLVRCIYPKRPNWNVHAPGKWVRVKFVEVKAGSK